VSSTCELVGLPREVNQVLEQGVLLATLDIRVDEAGQNEP